MHPCAGVQRPLVDSAGRQRFGDAARGRREELGLTQAERPERAGIHRTHLSDVKRGSRSLSLVDVERLAGALSLTMWELFRPVDGA